MKRDLIICTCNGVTAGQIEDAVYGGARTYEEVQELLQIGKQCIKCKEMASFIIESLAEELDEE